MHKIGMIALGCPKNRVDGEILLKKLNDNGFEIVSDIESSDLMIINTCGFIEDAKKEAIETILEVAQYKEAGIISAIVVTGCLAERYKDEVIEQIPEVDAVIGIGANNDIVKVCEKALCGLKTNIFPKKCYLPMDGERMLSTPSHWAYLKISEGCSNCCTYCAIPSIRGPFRSRSIESIVDEAKDISQKGVKEIIIIAQDTTRYGEDLYGKKMLPTLLKELVKIDEIKWIRLYYCYPDRVTDELIDVIANEDKICSYIDIPLQHCNKTLLKSMNRFGSYDTLKKLIDKMRIKIPDVSLRTTFMVGFPGETDEMFEELCSFVKDIKFDKMGCFTYSPEEGTAAALFDNQIDEDVKARRQEVLMNIQYDITQESNKKRIGSVFDVIIDEFNGDKYLGRSYLDSPEIDTSIYITSNEKETIGNFVKVKITDFDGYDLIGEII